MKLRYLFKDISQVQIRGSQEIEITGISSNSKSVAPGFLFIVKRGKTFDGSKFIPEAIQGGAVAILSDEFDPLLEGVTQVICENSTSIEQFLADKFYHTPADKLRMIGLTGTNGKTT